VVTLYADDGRAIPVETRIFDDYNALIAKGKTLSKLVTRSARDEAASLSARVAG
jgi:hypothetical protein